MVEIVQDFIPKGGRNRPGYSNPVNYLTIHSTANPDATAKDHASYIKTDACANRYASWHLSVDHTDTAYQHLPFTETAFHAGDGSGPGNRESISIEICEFTDATKQQKAIDNAAWLTARLLKDFNLTIDKVKQHYDWSGKNCPRILRTGNKWKLFLDSAKSHISPTSPPSPIDTLYRVIAGSFTTWEAADKQIANLKSAGFDSFTVGFILNKVTYIRVICGSYSKKENADKQIADLKAKGFDSFIVVYTGKDDPLPPKTEPVVESKPDLSKVVFRVIVNGKQLIALTGFDNAKAYAIENYPYDEIVLQNKDTGENIKIQDAKPKPEPHKPAEPEPVPESEPVIEPVPEPEYKYKLLGKSEVDLAQAKQWAINKCAHQRFVDIADIYWKYGEFTGIRQDVLYSQSAHETNFGKYTGNVIPEQNNWAGIKTRNPSGDTRDDHEYFATPEDGVRAHFNHIAAYAGLESVDIPHDRYYVVKALDWAGTIKYLEELSGKYAPSLTYHTKIVQFLEEMKATVVVPEPEPVIVEPEPEPVIVPVSTEDKLSFVDALLKALTDLIKLIINLIKGGK